MLYFTGDTHGDALRFSAPKDTNGRPIGAGDTLIVCGDFGFLFADDEREQAVLDELARKPYVIAFCDGNHENFDALSRLPVEKRYGAPVHVLRPNIVHLMRGNIYTIEGKTIFVFGGAYSIDRYVRVKGRSYWDGELPSNDDYRRATQNLTEVGWKVDYIVTHTAPREIIHRLRHYSDEHDRELTGFLEWVMTETDFRAWYFGHWHTDTVPYRKYRALYFDIVPEDNAAPADERQ